MLQRGRSKFNWLVRLGIVAMVGGFLLGAGSASAAGIDDLSDCSRLSDAIEQSDGSIVAVGTTSDCPTEGNQASPDHRMVLIGLNPDGSIKTSFGDGGMRLVAAGPDEYATELAPAAGDGFYLVTDRKITSYSAEGAVVGSFGDDGSIIPIPGAPANGSITGATITPDGDLIVAGASAGNTVAARYDSGGEPVDSFGLHGRAELDYLGWASLAVDSGGRIVLVGANKTARLLPDGALDVSFGGNGDGYGQLPSNLNLTVDGIQEVAIGQTGDITAYGNGTVGFYSYPGFAFTLDPDGEQIPGAEIEYLGNQPGAITPYPGGIAYWPGYARGVPPEFSLGSTGWSDQRRYVVTPGTGFVSGITLLNDGSLLAVGGSSWLSCGERCLSRNSMAIVKVDSATGNPITSFGTNGTRMIPANDCEYGQDGQVGEWNLCRVRPPEPTGTVRFRRAQARRPSLVIKAGLGLPPVGMWGTRQEFQVTVPRGLKLRKGGLRRRVSVRVRPSTPFSLRVNGRKIKVTVKPDYEVWDPSSGSGAGTDSPVHVRIGVKRGALARIGRPATLFRKKFKLRGTFIPVAGGIDLPATDRTWFAPHSMVAKIHSPPSTVRP